MTKLNSWQKFPAIQYSDFCRSKNHKSTANLEKEPCLIQNSAVPIAVGWPCRCQCSPCHWPQGASHGYCFQPLQWKHDCICIWRLHGMYHVMPYDQILQAFVSFIFTRECKLAYQRAVSEPTAQYACSIGCCGHKTHLLCCKSYCHLTAVVSNRPYDSLKAYLSFSHLGQMLGHPWRWHWQEHDRVCCWPVGSSAPCRNYRLASNCGEPPRICRLRLPCESHKLSVGEWLNLSYVAV